MSPAPARKHPLRSYRLSSPEAYRRVKTEGSVLRRFPVVLRALSAPDILDSRVGFVLRKKAGNAVMRNALRRILREIFREARLRFAKPVWVVFDVSDRVAEVTRTTFRQTALSLVESLCREPA